MPQDGQKVHLKIYPLEKLSRKNMKGMELSQSRWWYNQTHHIKIVIAIQFFTFGLVWTRKYGDPLLSYVLHITNYSNT